MQRVRGIEVIRYALCTGIIIATRLVPIRCWIALRLLISAAVRISRCSLANQRKANLTVQNNERQPSIAFICLYCGRLPVNLGQLTVIEPSTKMMKYRIVYAAKMAIFTTTRPEPIMSKSNMT